MQEFFAWYLAPWRKIGRGPFNMAVFAVAVPGLVLWFMGFGEHLSGIGGLLSGVGDAGAQLQNVQPDTPDMTNLANQLLNPTAPVAGGTDWAALGGWVDGLLWLACLPLVRMRVRDLGYANGTTGHWLWVAAAFAGTLPDMLTKLGLTFMDSVSTAGAVVSFIALLGLCIKHAPAPEREEHSIYTPPRDKAGP